jgi:hypothetical protein
MLFEEMNKHIAIARILVGKSPSTEPIARRQESSNDIRGNEQTHNDRKNTRGEIAEN